MNIERIDLIDKLETVKPALSANRVVPIMQHFWFTGDALLAYNSQIGISMPFKTDFAGAVREDALLGLLKASRAKALDLVPDGDHLAIKAPKIKSNLRLPLLPPEQFVFEMPPVPKSAAAIPPADMKAFAEALAVCLTSVSNDSTVPDQLGVTVVPDFEFALLYSTNYMSMVQSRVKLSKSGALKNRVILPKTFVQQVVKWAKTANEVTVHIADEYALCRVKGKDDDVTVFGRLIDSDNPLDFQQIMRDHLPKDYTKTLSPIPNKLKLVLDRAAVVCNNSTDEHTTSITAKKGKVYFTSKSVLGEVKDEMAAGDNQPDVQLRVEPELLLAACDDFDDYLLSEGAVIMSKPNTIYLVAIMK